MGISQGFSKHVKILSLLIRKNKKENHNSIVPNHTKKQNIKGVGFYFKFVGYLELIKNILFLYGNF